MTTTSGTSGTPTAAKLGRLGDPAMVLGTDPRSDPRMVAALAPFGLDVAGPPPPVDRNSSREALLEFIGAAEEGFEAVFAAFVADLPPVGGVERSTEKIAGPDGGEITLFVSRPASASGPLPGILHIHGGGMVMLRAEGPLFSRLRDELAATGMVVVGVEYRNGGGVLGNHPFPAGLDDCMAALRWVDAHRPQLGLSTLVVAGESGGANLALAVALRAKREENSAIDGVYGMCPFISGRYGGSDEERARDLPSLVENDGYLLGCAVLDVFAAVYDPGGGHATDPLAWPLNAHGDDLVGLPPHVISVNEVDPLRDEGLAYARALRDAGVSTRNRVVARTCHAGDLLVPGALPEVFRATINDIHAFASGL